MYGHWDVIEADVSQHETCETSASITSQCPYSNEWSAHYTAYDPTVWMFYVSKYRSSLAYLRQLHHLCTHCAAPSIRFSIHKRDRGTVRSTSQPIVALCVLAQVSTSCSSNQGVELGGAIAL